MESYGFTNVLQLLKRVLPSCSYDGVVVIEAVLEPIPFSTSKKVAFATKGIVQRTVTWSGEAGAGPLLAAGAARARKAGGGGHRRGEAGEAQKKSTDAAEKIGGCGRRGGCPGSPEQQRRGLGSVRTMRSARWKEIERSGSTSGPRRSAPESAARARKTG